MMRAATREAIETIALAVFLVLLLYTAVDNRLVEGSSMDPTLHELDRVLVSKVAYLELDAARVTQFIPGMHAENGEVWYPFDSPERGDVIVFRYPRDPRQVFVKRIIGLPGDTIEVDGNVVYVNGEPLDEPYVEHDAPGPSLRARVVEPESYYVLGDNRPASDDSRHWGTVPKDHIIGKVWVAYWPPNNVTTLFVRAAASLGVLAPPKAR